MPRLHVLSDVHREFGPYELPADLEADILVAAGDIGEVEDAVPWLAATGKPVVYVLGNHEYYGREFDEVLKAARAAARGTRVRVLERNAVVLHGVRFLGTTLWTSFGEWHPGLVKQAWLQMNDYQHIRATQWHTSPTLAAWLRRRCAEAGLPDPVQSARPDKPRPFHPGIAYREHRRSVDWLRRQLSRPFDGPTVVVTHHAPSFRSLEAFGIDAAALQRDRWMVNSLSEDLRRVAAYASPLDPLLAERRDRIDLWVHGHLHAGLDIVVEGVRVLANPRGYPLRKVPTVTDLLNEAMGARQPTPVAGENAHPGRAPDFDWRLTVHAADGLDRPLTLAAAQPMHRMRTLLAEACGWLPHLQDDDSAPSRAIREAFSRRVIDFNAALDTLLVAVAGGLEAGSQTLPLDVLAPPVERPSFDDLLACDRPRHAYARVQIDLMQAWIEWSEEVPRAAASALRAWGAATCRMLGLAREIGLDVRCVRLPTAALRSLLYSFHHSLYADGSPEQLGACGARLTEAFRDERPRRVMRLRPLRIALEKRLPLLTLEQVRAFEAPPSSA